jgi:hypothetical protein
MKYIKTYESLDFNREIDLIYKIIEFFQKHNLDKIDVNIDGTIIPIVYDVYDDIDKSTKWIWQIKNNKKDDIMVGTQRNMGVEKYMKILHFLENMSTEDIENERMKKAAEQYNL